MKHKKLFFSFLLICIAGICFAKTRVADLGDVRIYSLGNGNFEVESDRVRQCFPLTFKKKAGWVEVACSSVGQKITVDAVGHAVKYAVKANLTAQTGGASSIAGKYYLDMVSDIAEKVTSWAIEMGIEASCNSVTY